MIKLGVNTVLFGGNGLGALEVAMKHLAWAGFDGIEISALPGMAEHLVLDEWEKDADGIKKLCQDYSLEMLSMEAGTLDEERLKKAFAAGQTIGCPVINVGPGGQVLIPTAVDYSEPFGATDRETWEAEYRAHVTALDWLPVLPNHEAPAGTNEVCAPAVPYDFVHEFERMDPAQRQVILDELAERPELWDEESEVMFL